MYVWGVSRKTIPMQINVVGTVMLLVSVLVVVSGELNNRRRRRALAVDKPRRKDRALAAAGARSAAGTIDPA
jgi:hypothetical protein